MTRDDARQRRIKVEAASCVKPLTLKAGLCFKQCENFNPAKITSETIWLTVQTEGKQ